MFAVIRSGGKQHRVVKGERLNVDLLDVAEGSEIKIEDVLLLANGDAVQVGTPHVAGATVTAKLLSTIKVLRFAYSSAVVVRAFIRLLVTVNTSLRLRSLRFRGN